MPLPDGYVKAELAIDGGDVIRCLFNPTEYSITKANTWNFDKVKGTSLPTRKFGGGAPRELSVSLLLDAPCPQRRQDGQGHHRPALPHDGGAGRRRGRRRGAPRPPSSPSAGAR